MTRVLIDDTCLNDSLTYIDYDMINETYDTFLCIPDPEINSTYQSFHINNIAEFVSVGESTNLSNRTVLMHQIQNPLWLRRLRVIHRRNIILLTVKVLNRFWTVSLKYDLYQIFIGEYNPHVGCRNIIYILRVYPNICLFLKIFIIVAAVIKCCQILNHHWRSLLLTLMDNDKTVSRLIKSRKNIGFIENLIVYPLFTKYDFNTNNSAMNVNNQNSLEVFFKSLQSQDNRIDNMSVELLRLLTFKTWPDNAKQFPVKLAEAGFYYTGKDDEVECFSCRGRMRNWTFSMFPIEEHRENYQGCSFVKGLHTQTTELVNENGPNLTNKHKEPVRQFNDAGLSVTDNIVQSRLPTTIGSTSDETIPKELYNSDRITIPSENIFKSMENLEERLKSFDPWQYSDIVTKESLANAGLFYYGVSDRVQCAWCRGVLHKWKHNDDPKVEHHKFYPNCYFVRNDSFSSTEISSNGFQSNNSPSLNIKGIPNHPKYSTIISREESFVGWPSQLSQRPAQLAEAGFFYVGFGDCVKCFMCNGGLRNWASTDRPWDEHSHWFPDCEYVRKYGRNPRNEVVQTVLGASGGRNPQVLEDIISQLEDMGYNPEVIQNAIERYQIMNGGTASITVSTIVDMLSDRGPLSEDTQLKISPEVERSTRSFEDDQDKKKPDGESSLFDTSEEFSYDPKILLEENRSLKEKSVCKICMELPISVVFIPCGHFVCCLNCAKQLQLCPMCRAKIQKCVKAFLS